VCRAPKIVHRLSESPVSLWRNKGLPGAWAVLFLRAVVEDPAGCNALLPFDDGVTVAFRCSNALGIRNDKVFVAAWPTAHTFACLRFAERVAAPVARLATDPGGLTLDRAGFAPAGRLPKFHEVIAYSIPPRPASPGRTRTLCSIRWLNGISIFNKERAALSTIKHSECQVHSIVKHVDDMDQRIEGPALLREP
jgi:hypothetical protein